MAGIDRRLSGWVILGCIGVALLCVGCGEADRRVDSASGGALGIDSDGDGRTNAEEEGGYDILVDDSGFGPFSTDGVLKRMHVTSDPYIADTDGDGLDDGREYELRSNPRARDTDGDTLSDRDEWMRWNTSPVSVDTDGDARGPDLDHPLPPDPNLFDGYELARGRTSPSLADTDGDGKTDFEEQDDPLRTPLLADLPRAEIRFEGKVTVQLFVEYEETQGTEVTYGEEFSTTNTMTTSRSDSTSTAVTIAADKGGGGLLDDVIGGAAGGGLKGAATALAGPLLETARGAKCDFLADGSVNIGPLSFNATDPGQVGQFASTVAGAIQMVDGALADVSGICDPATPETTTTTTETLTKESSRSATESHSRYQSDSRSMTERTARGEVKYGARITNAGLQAFTLRDMFITMMLWEQTPGANTGIDDQLGNGTFRTLATLRPVVDQITLGPGDTSPVVEFQATDVNPAIIKQFLQRPKAVFYAPAGFELENAQGINFEFLTEQTFGRTATVVIDSGNGPSRKYLIATNVDRYSAADEAADPNKHEGDFAGITLGQVLDTLGIPYQTEAVTRMRTRFDPVSGMDVTEAIEVEALASLDGQANVYPADAAQLPSRRTGARGAPTRFWVLYPFRDEQAAPQDFADIVVQHGDFLRLVFVTDEDGDGFYKREEDLYGTVDSPLDVLDNATWQQLPGGDRIPDSVDSDRDGLTDYEEAKLGWRVCVKLDPGVACPLPTEPATLGDGNAYYYTYADPLSADGDADGLTDPQEKAIGSDPRNPDTDDDGLPDGLDPNPIEPQLRMYVWKDNPNPPPYDGLTWATAFPELRDALATARATNDNPATDPLDRISQIWVTQGVYTPSPAPDAGMLSADRDVAFELVPDVRILGGFTGGELKSGQRNPSPLTNGTILSGNRFGNDTGATETNDMARAENSYTVVVAHADATEATVLDGLTITGGNANEPMSAADAPDHSGGGLYNEGGSPTLRNVAFVANSAIAGGAYFEDATAGLATFDGCFFQYNQSSGNLAGGAGAGSHGGAAIASRARFLRCTFLANEATHGNGGALLARDTVLVDSCVFRYNEAYDPGGTRGGGAIYADLGTVRIVNSTFEHNRAEIGAALAVPPTTGASPSILQSRFWNNDGAGVGAAIESVTFPIVTVFPPPPLPEPHLTLTNCDVVFNSGGGIRAGFARLILLNCIVYHNTVTDLMGGGANGTVVACCTPLSSGAGVVTDDPAFVDYMAGDLRLQPMSPCIDRGLNFVDTDPNTPGIQGLPATDFGGSARVLDGDGDGQALVDIGLYEGG